SYVLQPYQMVKDLRTGVETSNVQAVLDGDINDSLPAALPSRVANRRQQERARSLISSLPLAGGAIRLKCGITPEVSLKSSGIYCIFSIISKVASFDDFIKGTRSTATSAIEAQAPPRPTCLTRPQVTRSRPDSRQLSVTLPRPIARRRATAGLPRSGFPSRAAFLRRAGARRAGGGAGRT